VESERQTSSVALGRDDVLRIANPRSGQASRRSTSLLLRPIEAFRLGQQRGAVMLRAKKDAAAMNDRWLFLAAFCLLLLGCGVVIYWLVKQLQAVLAGHKQARDTHQIALTQIIATQNETALKLAVCIDRNTAAMEDCTIELRRIRERE